MPPVVNENWSISVKIVVPIVGVLLSTTLWITAQIWRIEARQNIAWTLHDQREWAKEVKILHPEWLLPDPNDVFWKNRKPLDEFRQLGSTK